jgi:hypothetical protein
MGQHRERHFIGTPVDRVAQYAQWLARSQERGIGGRGGWFRQRVAADGLGRVKDQLSDRIDHRRFFF